LAIAAYRKLTETQNAHADDYDALSSLLERKQPVAAARVSLLAWQRLGEQRQFLEGLSLLYANNKWTEFARALKLLDNPSDAAKKSVPGIAGSAQFLRLVGGYIYQMGHAEQGRAYYARAFEIDPQSAETRTGVLWSLIDAGDKTAIRKLLARHERAWRQSGDMDDALAAAYQTLSLYHIALTRYLTPHLAAHENDFLWLMNYADALEQDDQTGRAWNLRRRLFAQQAKRLSTDQQGKRRTLAQAERAWLAKHGLDAAHQMARARLLMTQRPGDPALDVLRELLRLDRNAAGKLSDAAADIAFSWLQDTHGYGAERRFLWEQYARNRGAGAKRPYGAEINLALAEGDKAAVGQVLEQDGGKLSAADAVTAATAVGDLRLAQSIAFDNQLRQPDSDDLHQQLVENLLGFSNRVGVDAVHRDLGGLSENQTSARLHWPVNPRWSLDFQLDRINRSVSDPLLFRSAPDEDRAKLTVDWHHPDGETQLQVTNRRGYAITMPVLLQHEQRITSRLSLRGELGWHLPTDESLPLRVAGMKSRVAARLRYQFTPRDQVMLTQADERYRLQTGVEVGTGRHTEVEYTHTVWQGAPSLQAGVFWSTHHYHRRDPEFFGPQGVRLQERLVPPGTNLDSGYFLPTTFEYYGIRLSTNMQYEQDHTRPVRPYASVSRTWHSQLGPGYDLTVGIAGSVLGSDHLNLSWNISKSGVQSLGLVRTLQLSYRLNF
jgi:hypothetical protein